MQQRGSSPPIAKVRVHSDESSHLNRPNLFTCPALRYPRAAKISSYRLPSHKPRGSARPCLSCMLNPGLSSDGPNTGAQGGAPPLSPSQHELVSNGIDSLYAALDLAVVEVLELEGFCAACATERAS